MGFLFGCGVMSMSDAVDISGATPIDFSTDFCTIDTLGVSDNNEYAGLNAIWVPASVDCPAGTYLKAGDETCSPCDENNYCAGDTYIFSETTTQGIVACESGVSPQGSKTAYDCGRRLHVGSDVIYLHTNKVTTPSLNVEVDGVRYYANLTENQVNMNKDTERKMVLQYGGKTYYAYDNTVNVNE